MKKFLLIAVLSALVSFGASAQQGVAAVGVNLNFSPCVESGASHNPITDGLRGEIQAAYDFKKDYVSVFTGAVNFHYLFNLGERFQLYPILGLGYGNIHTSLGDLSDNASKFLFNVGVGGEVAVAKHFAISLEAKFQYMKYFKRVPISLGFAYKF